jgi:hypothetical protein
LNATQLVYNQGIASGFSANGLIRPKQVILPAKSAQGMEISGTFARRGGKIYLDITFTNRAMQPISDFQMQFNKNTFGLVPTGNLDVRSPVVTNSSVDASLQLNFNPLQKALKDPINSLQIAIKNNVSVFYFQTPLHLHVLFPEDGGVERSEYLKLWKEIPETNEHTLQISALKFQNADAVKNKLSLNNIFAVAERQVDNRTLVYCSTSVLPDRQVFLIELTFDSTFQSCNAAIKTYAVELLNPFQEALSAILTSN